MLDLTIEVVEPTTNELDYEPTIQVYVVDSGFVDMTPGAPLSDGTYDVDPALPGGVEIDTGSGIISGTPTETTELTAYTVTATNADETRTSVLLVQTCRFEYDSPVEYPLDEEIPDNEPFSDHAFTEFTIMPPLSAGLDFDTVTGVISGTPTETQVTTTYTVTGVTEGGTELETVVSIQVGGSYEYRADDQTVTYATDTGVAEFEVDLELEEDPDSIEYPSDLQGLQLGLAYDADLLAVQVVSVGSDLEDLNDGDGPGFFAASLVDDTISLGIISSSTLDDYVTTEEVVVVARVTFDTVPDAFIGNEDGLTTTIEFIERPLEDPAIVNIVIRAGELDLIAVATTDATIDLVPEIP